MLLSTYIHTHPGTILREWLAVHELRPPVGSRSEAAFVDKGRLVLGEVALYLEQLEMQSERLEGSKGPIAGTSLKSPVTTGASNVSATNLQDGPDGIRCLTIQGSIEDGRALRAAVLRTTANVPDAAGLLEGEDGARFERAIRMTCSSRSSHAHQQQNFKSSTGLFLVSVAGEEDPGSAVDALA